MSLIANLIKELREKSGAGIVDCKNDLLQNDNDIEKSIDWLRKKGLSVAAKKSGRVLHYPRASLSWTEFLGSIRENVLGDEGNSEKDVGLASVLVEVV